MFKGDTVYRRMCRRKKRVWLNLYCLEQDMLGGDRLPSKEHYVQEWVVKYGTKTYMPDLIRHNAVEFFFCFCWVVVIGVPWIWVNHFNGKFLWIKPSNYRNWFTTGVTQGFMSYLRLFPALSWTNSLSLQLCQIGFCSDLPLNEWSFVGKRLVKEKISPSYPLIQHYALSF